MNYDLYCDVLVGEMDDVMFPVWSAQSEECISLSKKVLLANSIGALWDAQLSAHRAGTMTAVGGWLGLIAFAFQIYFDFSGYSDMAIGLGAVFGFKFLENFNYPYVSRSMTDFWRRWHISLSSWFKNYVYVPLGGNREGSRRTCFNLFVVFLLTGVWHGAGWNFVVWGLWHGAFVIMEKLTGLHRSKNKKALLLRHMYTSLVIVIGWVVFRAENLCMRWIISEICLGCFRI